MSNEQILKQQIEALTKLLEIKNQIISELEKKNYYKSYYPHYPYYPQGTWITTNGNTTAQSIPNSLYGSGNITLTGTSGTVPVSTTGFVQTTQSGNLCFLPEERRNKQ